MGNDSAHANYLRDLGYELREAAEQAKREARSAVAADSDFEKGRLMA